MQDCALLRVFICCSDDKEDRRLLDKLDKHLTSLTRLGNIDLWNDKDVAAGAVRDAEIRDNLGSAHFVLLLVSADFNSYFIKYESEMKEAIARHEREECRVVPILLRPCDYDNMPYACSDKKIEMLPKYPGDQQPTPITGGGIWPSEDSALTKVAERLRQWIEERRALPTPRLASPSTLPEQGTWAFFFQNNPQEKKLKLIDTVNCDRTKPFTKGIQRHFEKYKDGPGNLLYLLTACRSQKPESLVKRLYYEFEADLIPHFRPVDENQEDRGKLLVPELALDRKKEKTFARLWGQIEDQLPQKGSFEDFARNPKPYIEHSENRRTLLAFTLYKQDFEDYEGEKQIAYILEQFARLPEASQRFVFCFVQYAKDIHHHSDPDLTERLEELDCFARGSSAHWRSGEHISRLPRVLKRDLGDWLAKNIDPTYQDRLFEEFTARHPMQGDSFDMQDIEAMQYAAYQAYVNHYQPAH